MISAIVIIVILLLIYLVGFVYCCYWKRRTSGKVQELELRESNYKPMESEISGMHLFVFTQMLIYDEIFPCYSIALVKKQIPP